MTVMFAAFIFSCGRQPMEEKMNQKSTPTLRDTPAEVTFSPPTDSTITMKQMTSWQRCNPLLDSLAFRYTDSFKTQNPEALLRYQEDFIAAQKKICVRTGLPGGYREYRWILRNMGIEKNRTVLESANAQSF
jgi:hypothetical protein